MDKIDTVVAVFANHEGAESAVKKLSAAGFAMKDLSLIGKGYHSEEKVVGFYNTGDRIKFWGKWGAFWGGFWGLFFGGLFISIPVIGCQSALNIDPLSASKIDPPRGGLCR